MGGWAFSYQLCYPTAPEPAPCPGTEAESLSTLPLIWKLSSLWKLSDSVVTVIIVAILELKVTVEQGRLTFSIRPGLLGHRNILHWQFLSTYWPLSHHLLIVVFLSSPPLSSPLWQFLLVQHLQYDKLFACVMLCVVFLFLPFSPGLSRHLFLLL